MKPRKILLIAVIVLAALVLGACATGPRVTSVPGMTATDNAVYVSNAQFLYKIDTAKAENVKNFVWQYPTKGSPNLLFYAPPLVDGDTVVVGDFANTLQGIDETTGSHKWSFTGAKGWYQSQAVRDGDRYYMANFDRTVYAIDASSHAIVKTYSDDFGFLAAPLVVGDKLIISSQNHKLIALDKTSFDFLWKADVKGSVMSAPYYDEVSNSLVVGTVGKNLVWIDADSGAIQKTYNDNGAMSSIWASPVKSGDKIVVTDDKGVIYLASADGSSVDKIASAGAMLAGALPVEGGFVTVTSSGIVRMIKDGETAAAWTQTLRGPKDAAVELDTTPVLSGDTIVVAGLTNNHTTLMVWGFDLAGNMVWSFPPEKE